MTTGREAYLAEARERCGVGSDAIMTFDSATERMRPATQEEFDLLVLGCMAAADIRRRANAWHKGYLEKRAPTDDELSGYPMNSGEPVR